MKDLGYNDLVGRRISNFLLSDDRETITLKTDKGNVIGSCYADCCSTTWIEDLADEMALVDATILNVEDIDMPNLGNISTSHMHYPEEVAYYGLRITTNKGICVIDYRNNSNGYYGGSINFYG